MGYKDEFQALIQKQRFEEARVILEENKAFAYDDSFYFANMGWVLNHIGRHQEAIPYLQKGIQAFPEDSWMYSQLGYAYNHSGDNKEALTYLLKGLSMGHDEAWIHGEIGWAYRELHEEKKAIEYFENALLDDPDNVWITAQAAFTYRDLGDKKSAEEYLKKVYRLSPDDDSLYDLANFYKGEMRWEEEIAQLDLIEKEDFRNWRDFEKAYAYNRLKRYQEAIPLLQDCLAHGRDDTGIREELADAYMGIHEEAMAKEQYEIALSYYEKAAARNEEDAYWIYQDMVWIAHKMEDPIKKLQYLDRLWKVKEGDPWALYHYAKTYANLGEYEKALSYCEQCIEKEGKREDVSSLKAWILGKLKKFDEAIALLLELEANGRKDCWLYNELGWDYSEVEKYEEAIHSYEKSISIDEEDAWVLSQIAWNMGSLKKYEEALSWFFKAEKQGREDGWLYANIGWNYSNLEQYDKAMEYYQLAEQKEYKEEWFLKQKKSVEDKLSEKDATQ